MTLRCRAIWAGVLCGRSPATTVVFLATSLLVADVILDVSPSSWREGSFLDARPASLLELGIVACEWILLLGAPVELGLALAVFVQPRIAGFSLSLILGLRAIRALADDWLFQLAVRLTSDDDPAGAVDPLFHFSSLGLRSAPSSFPRWFSSGTSSSRSAARSSGCRLMDGRSS